MARLQLGCLARSRSWGDYLRILLVEDDRDIGDAVKSHAATDGHAIDWAVSLDEAAAHVDVVPYGLILLDLVLPDGSGVGFLRALRRKGNLTPVIILTARDQFSDRIEGLNAGADDYLVKPFNLGELSARIHAVARRYKLVATPVLDFGGLMITPAERRVERSGSVVELTAREWSVLEYLLERPGTAVPKSRIEDALYAFGAEIESNAVEVYVSRLRKKLGVQRITTMRGIGYRFNTSIEPGAR